MNTGHESEAAEIKVDVDGPTLFEDISLNYLNEHLSDITLLVANEKFPAHKAILASRSKYFKTWFIENPDKNEMTILKTSPQAFRILLKYIYTGSITICSENELILQVLILACQYSLAQLSSSIVSKFDKILDIQNVFFFLNGANDHDLDKLRDACHLVMDNNPLEILSCDSFNFLTQESLIQILKRDTFAAPEVEIFKSVAKWCEMNKNSDSLVLDCIRFSALSVHEITSIVCPTKLVNSDKIVEIISEIVGNTSENLADVAASSVNKNVATLERGAELMFPYSSVGLTVMGNKIVRKNIHHMMDEKNTVVIRLGGQYPINHIRMKLYDNDNLSYSYYIETSLDQRNWHRIINYTRYCCRSVQNLYFNQQEVQYIKIVGASTFEQNSFHLVLFEAFYKSKIPKIINTVIRPETNVATLENGARVIQGKNPKRLLDGNDKSCTYHVVGDSKPIIIQLAQPYYLSSIKLLLHSKIESKYFIETSRNGRDWQVVVDRSNEICTSWQNLHFKPRVVVFFKLTGTYSSFSTKGLFCYRFECPSNGNE